MRRLRVAVLMHEDLVPPETLDGQSEKRIAEWKVEYDVCAGLVNLDHEILKVGVARDLGVLQQAIDEWKPHIAFNVLEEFHGVAVYDHHVISYLELLKMHYTGCNPRGLMLAHDKALAKKILTFHGIDVPHFAEFPRGTKPARPPDLRFPLMVKSVIEEGSLGISQASVVTSDRKLAERVEFIHEQLDTDAIAEEFIDGREFYVGVIGNRRLETFPVWEIVLDRMKEGVARIASSKVKWDPAYQKRHGITTRRAKGLDPALEERIVRTCKEVYRVLGLSGYARMDLRLSPEGRLCVLEANPNPNLAYGEDFAESAESIGIEYEDLIHRILSLGLTYPAEWKAFE